MEKTFFADDKACDDSPHEDNRADKENGTQKSVTCYTYDAAGNVTEQSTKCASDTWRVVRYAYDNRGRQTDVYQYKNAAHIRYERTRYGLDGVGNKIEVHTGLTENALDHPAVERYGYDKFGAMVRSGETD